MSVGCHDVCTTSRYILLEDRMPAELQYMPTVVNVGAILEKIRGAGTPPKFTHDFLKSTLGFASSNDRSVIKILRTLGFLSADGTPTQRYNEFKGTESGKALAVGLREGWAELFLADQKVNEKSVSQIQAIAKTLTGAGDSTSQKMASTFKAFADKADWSGPATSTLPPPATESLDGQGGAADSGAQHTDEARINDLLGSGQLRLHHDIHLHLPPSPDVSVYRAIFQAIKAELM
jgi:hypothetical protein